MSKFITLAKIFVLTVAVMLVSSTYTFAAASDHSFHLVNRTNRTIIAVVARPSGSADVQERTIYTDDIVPNTSAYVSFEWNSYVKQFDIRVFFDDGEGWAYVGVEPDSIHDMILRKDGTVSYS